MTKNDQIESGDGRSPWERLPRAQQQQVTTLVADAIKRGDFNTSDFERLCNTLAAAIQNEPKIEPAKIFQSMLPSQHDVRERIEDIAGEAMSAELPPNREKVSAAQQKLNKLSRDEQAKIEAEIEARIKQEKAPDGKRLTIIARVLAREKILVALMNDDAAVEQILAQPTPEAGIGRPR